MNKRIYIFTDFEENDYYNETGPLIKTPEEGLVVLRMELIIRD